MTFTRALTLVTAVTVLGFAWACREADGNAGGLLAAQRFDSRTFQDLPSPVLDFAGLVVAPEAPQRVVSLVSSVTELVFALEMGDRLVGRSDWCDWPREASAVPALGQQQSMSKERVADLRPDLVILFRNQHDLAQGLREDFGLRVVTPATETAETVFDGMSEVAEALGVPERGAVLVAHLRRELEAVRREFEAESRPSVLIVIDREPLFVAGRSSFVGELLEIAGARNAAGNHAAAWPSVDPEQMLDWDPDVVIDVGVGDDLARDLGAAAAYWERHSLLRAVRQRRVVLLQTGVLTRPGPRMAAAARRLAEVIHGR